MTTTTQTKMTPEELKKEEKELKLMMAEAVRLTPKDSRNLTVINFDKKGFEIHMSHISMNKVESSFEVARRDLKGRISHQKKSTIGWIVNGVLVYREIDKQDISREFLNANPEQKEMYYKYGFCDYFQTSIKFIVKHKDGTRTVHYSYKKPRSNENEDVELR